MELQFGLIFAGCCVDISGVLIQRNDGCVSNEDVSKAFETSVQVCSSGIEILDGVIENLSEECNESRFEPVVKRRVGELIAVSHLDVAVEKRLQR
ncbi:hypothetical protein C498_02855, partial [Haloferax volcanii DS2]